MAYGPARVSVYTAHATDGAAICLPQPRTISGIIYDTACAAVYLLTYLGIRYRFFAVAWRSLSSSPTLSAQAFESKIPTVYLFFLRCFSLSFAYRSLVSLLLVSLVSALLSLSASLAAVDARPKTAGLAPPD